MYCKFLIAFNDFDVSHLFFIALYHVFFVLWSDNAYSCDPRIARFKLEEKERKQAEKRVRQEAFRQKADEEEKVCI